MVIGRSAGVSINTYSEAGLFFRLTAVSTVIGLVFRMGCVLPLFVVSPVGWYLLEVDNAVCEDVRFRSVG